MRRWTCCCVFASRLASRQNQSCGYLSRLVRLRHKVGTVCSFGLYPYSRSPLQVGLASAVDVSAAARQWGSCDLSDSTEQHVVEPLRQFALVSITLRLDFVDIVHPCIWNCFDERVGQAAHVHITFASVTYILPLGSGLGVLAPDAGSLPHCDLVFGGRGRRRTFAPSNSAKPSRTSMRLGYLCIRRTPSP